MKKLLLFTMPLLLLMGCNSTATKFNSKTDDIKIKYLGHGSLKLYLPNNKICYIDPYAGEDYSDKADLVLVTHQHQDHNKLDLLNMDDNTIVFQNFDAITNEGYHKANFLGMEIEPVEAYNKNHKKEECVGYILRVNNKVIYVAGDTSKTNQMNDLSNYNIDYAFLPMDGKFNMDVDEAIECAEIINAKHTIPYHMAPGKLFDEDRATLFKTPSSLIIKPGEIITIN